MKKKPVARKKTAARKAVAKKAAARKAPKKRTAPAKANKLRLVAPKPALQPKPTVLSVAIPPPPRPGLHLPMKPPPAYAQMIQRDWAHKPPPHKLTK